MRNVTNWQVYPQGTQPAMNYGGRGYTGHEHLNGFGLINMNARLYDPVLGRFLAPDPFVGSGMTNDFNRYIYGRNNPLMYTDPSGKSFADWWQKNIADPFMREFHQVFGNGQGGWEIGYNSAGGIFTNPTYNGAAFGPSAGISNSGQFTMGSSQGGFHNMTSVTPKIDPAVANMSEAEQSYYRAEKYRESVEDKSIFSKASTYFGGTGSVGDVAAFGATNASMKLYGNTVSGVGSLYSLGSSWSDFTSGRTGVFTVSDMFFGGAGVISSTFSILEKDIPYLGQIIMVYDCIRFGTDVYSNYSFSYTSFGNNANNFTPVPINLTPVSTGIHSFPTIQTNKQNELDSNLFW